MTARPQPGRPEGFARESSRIGGNLIAMVASRFLCLALSLVQMGIVFRALSVDGAGQFGFALNYPALFTVFATLGIQRLLMRDIARNHDAAWTQVWTAAAVLGGLSVLVTGVIMGSMAAIEPNAMTRQAVLMATLSVIVLYAVQRPFEALLMARERMVAVSLVNLVGGVGRLVFTYLALQAAPTSAGAHAGIAVGNLLAFVLCVAAAIRVAGWERPRICVRLAWRQIVESNAFTVAVLFSLIYFKSDMSLLKWLQGESAAGIYTAAQRVTEPLFMIAAIWGTTVFPALCRFSVHAPDNYERLVRTSARLVLLVAFPMGFGLAALAGPVIGLLTGAGGGEFAQSVTVLRLLCVVTPFFYFNSVGQEFLYARHRNWFVVASYGAGSVASIAANLVLIPRYGAEGAAYAAILANGLISVLFFRGMRGDYGTMRLLALCGKTTVACSAMAGAAWLIAPYTLAGSVAAGAVIYVALQYLLRTLNGEEQALVGSLISAGLGKLNRTGARA